MSYYDSDDAVHRSPGLQVFKPKAIPSPSPPPFIPRPEYPLSPGDSPGDRKRHKHSKRRSKPSQSDRVLIQHLSPNDPEVSRLAGEEPLNSASHSEESEVDSDMEGKIERGVHRSERLVVDTRPLTAPYKKHQSLIAPTSISERIDVKTRPPGSGSDAKTKDGPEPPGRPRLETRTNGISSTNLSKSGGPDDPSQRLELQTPQSAHDSVINGQSPSAVSPKARTSSISRADVPADQTLPPLQNPLSPPNSVGSPNQTLPGFKEFVARAEKSKTEDEVRTNGYHRASISTGSGSAGSPTLSTRHYSISTQRSSSTQLPSHTHASPVSAHSDISPHDPFLRSSTLNAHTTMINRRTSQASEAGPPQFPASMRAASSPDVFSPSSQISPSDSSHRMSIDGAIRPILPPPNPSVQAVPMSAGVYKCEHPGCNAPPFSTHYLLNSHANVHSQNRPHYCPIQGCPRAEGGKGFKRKNEMIRHGLVHDSPGYICPFCPDREHRYPRPDNLQRHVRVHHVDKDKDDPQLRDVLSQRPEGGSRGRRRRGT